VLELGAGIGNLAGQLMGKRAHYVAGEKDPLYLHALRNRFLRTPNVSVLQLDPGSPADFQPLRESTESVLCVNVLEHVEDPQQTLRSIRDTLQAEGVLLVLVPQGRSLYGTIDQTLGHKRRFDRAELEGMLAQNGFSVERTMQLNKIATPAWWLYGRILKRKHISKVPLKVFDKTVWIWRRLEHILPWPGLSLIAIARRTR
jgi:SAM-dependent methyltransferase